jgi:hypothetical protein
MNRREQLAGFHHTISEQLNARLSESPKFFGLLIVVSTGYGYVLSKPDLRSQKLLFCLASLLSYAAVFWSAWYLAALGYAFRFLQNSQHCIEHALGWNPDYVPLPENGRMTGQPPWPPVGLSERFWLLPGIYVAHAAGLSVLLVLICGAFCWQAVGWLPYCLVPIVGLTAVAFGLAFIIGIHRSYLNKFRKRWRDPNHLPVLS